MESFLIPTGVVTLAEMGDKTQLLAFLLAARFRKPVPIILGILAATLANHALAGGLGVWITTAVRPEILRWILGVSFIVMALWTLVPDKPENGTSRFFGRFGVFGATLVAFFLAEMGDKTQVATIAMSAHYAAPLLVIAGTTLGMMIADVPAVFIGDRLVDKIPMRLMRNIAATAFALLGVATLLGAGSGIGF